MTWVLDDRPQATPAHMQVHVLVRRRSAA
jgi:hypothetical protein